MTAGRLAGMGGCPGLAAHPFLQAVNQFRYRGLLPVGGPGGGAGTAFPAKVPVVDFRVFGPDGRLDFRYFPFRHLRPLNPMVDIAVVGGIETTVGMDIHWPSLRNSFIMSWC